MTGPATLIMFMLFSSSYEIVRATEDQCQSMTAALAKGQIVLAESKENGRVLQVADAFCVPLARIDEVVGRVGL